jgi:hypothetical protein
MAGIEMMERQTVSFTDSPKVFVLPPDFKHTLAVALIPRP